MISSAYVILGITLEGFKEMLSITAGANENSTFWLRMINDLKTRGVRDTLFLLWVAFNIISALYPLVLTFLPLLFPYTTF